MAERSPLQRGPGLLASRILPKGWDAREGSYVWCLGSDEPGWRARLSGGDEVRISQTGAMDGARLIRAKAHVRAPQLLAPGWHWQAQAYVNASLACAFSLEPGTETDIDDLAISTQGLAGDVTLSFALRLYSEEGDGGEPAELEVPAFYLDALVLDAGVTGLHLVNRMPAPGATGVPRTASVHVDVVDTEGSAPDVANTTLYLQGVPAMVAGAVQPGYSVTIQSPLPGVKRFTISAPYLFASQATVEVRVLTQALTGGRTLEETYSFETEDTQGAELESAVCVGPRTLRVTFNEDMQLQPALQPGNYTVERHGAPAVQVQPVSVSQVSAQSFDVRLTIPISPRVAYSLVVDNMEDAHGNPVVAPYNTLEFQGYAYSEVQGRDFSLLRMLPQMNRDEDATGDLVRLVGILQEPVDVLLHSVDRWTDILDVDVAEEKYLDQMLVRLGNPFRFPLSVDDKRRLIRVLVPIRKQKGTDSGMVNAIRFFLNLEVTIRAYSAEGWELGEDELGVETILGPDTLRRKLSFEVVSLVVLTEEQRMRIRAVVAYMKPSNTHHVRTVEPQPVTVIDHLELGLSELGVNFLLH